MKYILVIFTTNLVYAAGGSAEGSPLDLIPGFVNLVILVSLLSFILRKPLGSYFTNKSQEVKNTLDRASAKAKEAEMMMQIQKQKIAGSDQEVEKIKEDAKTRIDEFKEIYSAEVNERISKMKDDAALKIESEKKDQMDKLSSSFIDEVISGAKVKIKSNQEMQESATNKVLRG